MEAVEEPPPVDEPVEVSAEAPEEEKISILTDDDDIDGFDDDLPDGLDLPPDDDDDFVESMGMEVESMEDEFDEDTAPDFPEELPEEPSGAEPLSVTTEQVEAALENVVKEMFGEKMERILIDVVKKTISQEIDRLKETLLEDLKGDA